MVGHPLWLVIGMTLLGNRLKGISYIKFCKTLFLLFCAPGSMPPATSFRAASLFSLASPSDISGYVPSASNFSFPAKKYLKRQYLPPLGFTKRNNPSPSVSLYGVALCLVFLIVVSVSAIGGVPFQSFTKSTPKSTPINSGCQKNILDGKNPKTGYLYMFQRNFLDSIGLRKSVKWCPGGDSNSYDLANAST